MTEEMLAPLPTGERSWAQFSSMLTDDEFIRVAKWLTSYPDVTLRAYGSYDGSITNLEFLRFFPSLKSFGADALFNSLESIDGLRFLPTDLHNLSIGQTRKRLDLATLDRFEHLKTLYLEGQTKNIAAVASLGMLEELTLRSITLPDLKLLLPLKRLLALDIKLGGTTDLSQLPGLVHLRYLELWMVKGLTDISPIGSLPELRYLFLQSLRRVEEMPDLSGATDLRRIHLETMRGLRDLRPLATAPALEDLILLDMRHLAPADLQCLVGLTTLRRATVGLGSVKKNVAAADALGLPRTEQLKIDWRQV